MPSTLQESLSLVEKLRAENGATVAHLNDQELADLAYQQTKDERLAPAMQSSALQRGINYVGTKFGEAGKSVEGAIADENSPFAQRLAGRVAGNLVASVPETAAAVASASMRGLPRALTALTGAGYVYGKSKAETNDTGASLGQAGGYLASLAGGVAGARLGASKAATPLGKKVAGGAGAIVGSMPGDYLGAVTQPGETASLEKFREDPLNVPAYFAGQVAMDVPVHLADAAGAARTKLKEITKAKTPELSSLVEKSAQDRFAELKAKPVHELTELEANELNNLGKSLAEKDAAVIDAKLAAKPEAPDVLTMPEAPVTLKLQLNRMLDGKRSAVEVAKGTPVPDLPDIMLHFKNYKADNGSTFIYDERRTNPNQIDNAIKTNSVGHLLGYGVGGLPEVPNGKVAVLRNKRGQERATVVLDDASTPAVLDALRKQGLADDVVSVESPEQVLKWRKDNAGLTKLFSLASTEVPDPQGDISFTNHVLDMFGAAQQPKIKGWRQKGPRFSLDAEGNINGTGILKAVKEWAPAELFEHYKARGIETILTPNSVNEAFGTGAKPGGKVSGAEFAKWLRDNTPEVEIKKLAPPAPGAGADARFALAQHELESLGYVVRQDMGGEWLVEKNGEAVGYDIEIDELPRAHQAAIERFGTAEHARGFNDGRDSDAATGYFGVDPKTVDQMPGAVDILVRVPTTKFDAAKLAGYPSPEEIRASRNVMFKGPHFGDSDVNVLASIRGYMETTPAGEKVFHVFEVQSDWGQTVTKQKQANPSDFGSINTKDHPLLAHYETLALKTAIQHARAEGATRIAISDAETAMMTEGHDRQAQPELRRIDGTVETPAVIQQESGMRAAYDQRLVAIAKKLTGDSGRREDFGVHLKAGYDPSPEVGGELKPGDLGYGSPVFKDAVGKPKTRITARSYDITKPNPSIRRLFSLYDLDAQNSFEAGIRRVREQIDSGERPSEELSREQILQRAVDGNLSKLDPIVKFLDAIRGERGVIRTESFDNPEVIMMADLIDKTITVNRDVQLRVNEAAAKLAHEQVHFAVDELAPAAQVALENHVAQLGERGRKAILDDLKERYKLGELFDTEYLSGMLFDKNDEFASKKIMHEFVGGLTEAMFHAHAAKQPTGWLAYMPPSIGKVVMKVVQRMKNYFNSDYPSITAMLSKQEGARLNEIVKLLENSVVDSEQINMRSLLDLHKAEKFDASAFVDRLGAADMGMDPLSGPSELASFASSIYEPVKQVAKDKFKNYIFSGMFRARTKPETAGHFWALHNLRPNNKADEHGYLAFLGQSADGSLSREQSIERWAKFFDNTVLDTGAKGEKFRNAFGDIAEENQNRREKSDRPLTDLDVVSTEEMQSKHGLDAEQAEFAKRLVKVTELVAQEALRKSEAVDTITLTKLFYGANKMQDIEGVRAKVQRLSRIAGEAGKNRFELDATRSQLDRVRKAEHQDLEYEGELNLLVKQKEALEVQFQTLLDHNIRQEFAGAIPFKEGFDPFVNRVTDVLIKLSGMRARDRKITEGAGWASMTRRGRFRLRVWDTSELGEEFSKVKEYKGFQTEEEMNAYIRDNKLTEDEIEKYDMNEVRDRVRSFTPDRLQRARDIAKRQLDDVLTEVQSKNSDLDPAMAEVLGNAINEIKTSFQPLDKEISDVIATKGDKFGQRRYNVAGFNKNDFLPNTFEYMQYKTIAGNKAIARAESDLQISRRELDNQADLRERMKKEQDYVLNTQAEWNAAKKLTFYYYLGANFRHVIQNSVQIPMNGISQMVSDGTGVGKAYLHFGKAAKLAAEYGVKGTTGDKVIDSMLKQAEKDGISFSTAIEAPLHEGDALQNVLDSINAHADGKVGFGQKLSLAKTKVWRGMEKFLQATSEAAEAANRKTTFIAGVLAERERGNRDLRSQYDKASQFTNFVNFVGDKANRPGFMIDLNGSSWHAPVGLLTALQSFTINHISQLASFYQRGFKGGNVADKRAFYTGVAHLLAFSGSMGFIGASTAEQLFETVTGISLKTAIRQGLVDSLSAMSDDEEEKTKLAGYGDRVTDGILYGLPALAGIDASNSIGLGSPLVRYQANKTMAVTDVAGPTVGMLGRVAQSVGKVATDPFNPTAWWDATRTGAPSFLSNAIKTYDALASGSTLDANRQPIGEPLDVAGSAAAVMGFNPMQTSKQREFNNRIYVSTKKSADEYQRISRNIGQLFDGYQKTGNQASQESAQEMLDKYLESTGFTQDRDALIKSIGEQYQQQQGMSTRPATAKESSTRQRLEQTFPSVKSRYPSGVDSTFDDLAIAQFLGQDDVLARMMASLPQTLQTRVLRDALMASGLRPEELQSILSPQSVVRQGR